MQSRLPISVAVITLNEEDHLPRCLASVRELASEIVVVDSGSTDRTAEIAKEAGTVYRFEPWAGHVAQKNKALAACSQPFVLSLDADEEVSPELAEALHQLFADRLPEPNGFWINRRTFYLGQWIHHSWNPEWRVRLVRKERAQWMGRDPHDRLEVTGNTSRLSGDILHYSYTDLQDHFGRTLRYARISAETLRRDGKTCRWYHLVFSPWLAFLKKLILKSAWRDGWRGWIISVATFFGVFAKYAFRMEMQLNSQLQPVIPASDGATTPTRTDSKPADV